MHIDIKSSNDPNDISNSGIVHFKSDTFISDLNFELRLNLRQGYSRVINRIDKKPEHGEVPLIWF